MHDIQKKFVAYYRVSSKRQKDEGVSLEAQRKLIHEYAKRNNYIISKEFPVDESAKKENRVKFSEMVKLVKDNADIKGIIAEKVDRLLRGNLKDRLVIEDLINESGKEIHLVKESLVLSSDTKSSQKLQFDIQNALARHYLNNLSDEVKKGYDILVSDGYYPHIPPIGYQSRLQNHLSIVDANVSPYIKRAFELCATQEQTEKSISEILYQEGFRSRKGRRVGKASIGQILHNPFYYGDFVWDGEAHKGNHEPIINKDLFDKVQEALNPRKKKGYKHDFAFVGLMRCGECSNGITAELQRGHIYYHCTKPHGSQYCSQKYVREEIVAEQLVEVVKRVSLSLKQLTSIKEIMKDSHQDESEYLEQSLSTLNQRYSFLKDQSDKLLDLYLSNKIAEDVYDRKSKELGSEMETVNNEIYNHKKADRAYFQEIETFLTFCNEAPQLFANSRPELQRQLLRYVVSNMILKDKKVEVTLKTPFDLVSEYAQSEDWQGRSESNTR